VLTIRRPATASADFDVAELARSGSRLRLPASGATAERFAGLAAIAEGNLVAARLVEAHADALAILAELRSPPPTTDRLWGVWAAETTPVTLHSVGGDWRLHGMKSCCSGAHLCSHALVTAGDVLVRVDLDQSEVHARPSNWCGPGMSGSDTAEVEFDGTRCEPVGRPGDYLNRPGFWHGAVGVAACWHGGARAIARTLQAAHEQRPLNPHALAHLGAIEAQLFAAWSTLMAAADVIDAQPDADAHRVALSVRAVVERAATETIDRVGRALGPAPLAVDGVHAQRVADLLVYLRQSHAERDLEALGRLVVGGTITEFGRPGERQ
jgi:alkylation response protein AidB-like acyl-CoA dehydrogenase